jgi:penicillin-binding protein 1B
MVTFREIPPGLVHAVVSAEDKHFFQHRGLDLARIMKAAYVDVQAGRKEQGASTLTMQLVRGLWLGPEKRWKRKFAEGMMTIYLEHKWSKEEIFETYANQVYLGRQAAYSVHGFSQASQMFFVPTRFSLSLSVCKTTVLSCWTVTLHTAPQDPGPPAHETILPVIVEVHSSEPN